MASISLNLFHEPIHAHRSIGNSFANWQAVRIETSGCTVYLSREEAVQLAADLLEAADHQAEVQA